MTNKSNCFRYQHCWCSGIMQDSHYCDPGSFPGRRGGYSSVVGLVSNIMEAPILDVWVQFSGGAEGDIAQW